MATLKEMIAADIAKRKGQKKPGLMDALRNSARVMDDGFFGGAFQRIPAETNRLMQRPKAAPAELNALVGPQMRQKVNTALAKPAPANPQQWIDKGMELSGMAPFMGMVGQTVYHGSPHKFDKFDMSKIGTGEGAQAYGHGLYFADSPEVAKSYQNMVRAETADGKTIAPGAFDPEFGAIDALHKAGGDYAKAKQLLEAKNAARGVNAWPEEMAALDGLMAKGAKINSGAFYKVDIPDETIPRMLDWDRPLPKDSDVYNALRANPMLQGYLDNLRFSSGQNTGEMLYRDLSRFADEANTEAGQFTASSILKDAGIPGIRYLDGNSRGTGGTSNYVLFDDQLPRILEVNGVPTGLEPWPKNKLWPK